MLEERDEVLEVDVDVSREEGERQIIKLNERELTGRD